MALHVLFATRVLGMTPGGYRRRGHGMSIAYTIADGPLGRTLVEHVHAGWPGTHGNFRKCNTTWGVLLHHLRDYVETGNAAPAFD